jgi:hypothetical protein
MNWKTVGKVLFFVGLGILVYNQIHSAFFSGYYGVSFGDAELARLDYKIWQWFDGFQYAINSQILGWSGMMIAGAALWIGGRKKASTN